MRSGQLCATLIHRDRSSSVLTSWLVARAPRHPLVVGALWGRATLSWVLPGGGGALCRGWQARVELSRETAGEIESANKLLAAPHTRALVGAVVDVADVAAKAV